MEKMAIARERLRVAQSRTGRTPMRIATLLRKERDATLYKNAYLADAFARHLAKTADLRGNSAVSSAGAHGSSEEKREVVRDILRKYPALARRGSVAPNVKQAGALGRLRDALKSPAAREHLPEIAGLGVLAVPGLDTLQAHARARLAKDQAPHAAEKRRLLGEGAHAALDVGGLGVLMAPELRHLRAAR
jgi:hypothetical protein